VSLSSGELTQLISQTAENEPARLLVVDDDPLVLASLKTVLSGEGYRVSTASSGEEALSLLNREAQDLLVVDIRMEPMNGVEVLKHVKARWPATEVILLTGYQTVSSALEAIRYGAYDYLLKPCNPEHLKIVIQRGLEREKAGKDYRQMLDLLQKIVSRLPQGVVLLGSRGTLLLLNPVAERLLGMNGSHLGQSFETILEEIPGDLKGILQSILAEAAGAVTSNPQESETSGNGLHIRTISSSTGTLLLLDEQAQP